MSTKPSRSLVLQKQIPQKKSRTGCLTCRARKIRCDEGKPACDRCLTTGRQCEGYAVPGDSTPASPSSSSGRHAAKQRKSSPRSSTTSGTRTPPTEDSHGPVYETKLALPRSNSDEVRSHRFFLEVAAPSLAGVFDGDFWLREIPRACNADPAIWHAVVSLGAVYESYRTHEDTSPTGVRKYRTFALQQYNSSIRCLVNASSRSTDKRQALIASVIFTCVCSIQGLYKQARVHVAAGRQLLKELEEDHERACKDNRLPRFSFPALCSTGPSLSTASTPFNDSIRSIRSIIINFETQMRALDNGGLNSEVVLVNNNESFNVWRFYEAPSQADNISSTSLERPGVPPIVYTTAENLLRASRAAESLLNGLVIFSQHHAEEIGALLSSGSVKKLEILISRQEPHTRCFLRLAKAIRLFNSELDNNDIIPRNSSAWIQAKKTVLTLSLFHSSIRMLLYKDPDIPDPMKRMRSLNAQFRGVVDLAEQILQLDTSGNTTAFHPTSPISQPLFLVVISGFPQGTRRRALNLMKLHPCRDGLWDTSFTTTLGEAIMLREQVVGMQENDKRGTLKRSGGFLPYDDDDDVIPTTLRVHNMRIKFEAERHCTARLTTWKEWIAGIPGDTITIKW